MYGSKPSTSMPRRVASLATLTPIAPRPITPSFFPAISVPAKAFLAFSAVFPMFSSSLFSLTHWIPPTMSRLARSIPAKTNSLTPFALAPGVLNTTIPSSAHFTRGILLTPAPALAIHLRLLPSSKSCIAAERTKQASASLIFSTFL